jgi:hypothetical protein
MILGLFGDCSWTFSSGFESIHSLHSNWNTELLCLVHRGSLSPGGGFLMGLRGVKSRTDSAPESLTGVNTKRGEKRVSASREAYKPGTENDQQIMRLGLKYQRPRES